MSAKSISVDIFAFVEYRVFLGEYYRARKSVDAKFSHRFISSHVRAGSAGWFADIVKGRANLSSRHTVALARLLNLTRPEAEYFETLVRLDQAGSVEEKNFHYLKLVSLKGIKPELIAKERFEFYSAWYHAVIRELLFFHDFRGDYADLARRLNPPITVPEARKSIKLLESLDFIKKAPSGRYQPTSTFLKKDPRFKALHFLNYMKANIALGLLSLETVPKEERDISTMTLSLSDAAFETAKGEIKALRDRLLALTETDAKPDKVFQFNFHAFPVSRSRSP